MTQEGDLILVYMEGEPAFFARIEAITGDVKPDWFQVKMLVLQVPVVVITWILREPYINGEEFTMGGHPIRMEKVEVPEQQIAEEPPGEPSVKTQPPAGLSQSASSGKVVSIFEKRHKG